MNLTDVILADHLRPYLRLVFCGTAPGAASAKAGHYYANPVNRFWRLLHETGLTPRRLSPKEDYLLPTFGIGLTDLAKTAFGQDADIPRAAFDADGLFAKITSVRPASLAFTSLTAARLALSRPRISAGMLEPDARLPGVSIWALPSPSGLAQSHFSLVPWQALAASVQKSM